MWREKIRFAEDQWQFGINRPRQKSLLKSKKQLWYDSLLESPLSTRMFSWPDEKTLRFHLHGCLSNFCSTSLLKWSLSLKGSLVPCENATLVEHVWTSSFRCMGKALCERERKSGRGPTKPPTVIQVGYLWGTHVNTTRTPQKYLLSRKKVTCP